MAAAAAGQLPGHCQGSTQGLLVGCQPLVLLHLHPPVLAAHPHFRHPLLLLLLLPAAAWPLPCALPSPQPALTSGRCCCRAFRTRLLQQWRLPGCPALLACCGCCRASIQSSCCPGRTPAAAAGGTHRGRLAWGKGVQQVLLHMLHMTAGWVGAGTAASSRCSAQPSHLVCDTLWWWGGLVGGGGVLCWFTPGLLLLMLLHACCM